MNNLGCSETTTDQDFSSPQFQLLFAPTNTQQLNITKIIITVEGDDFVEPIKEEIKIEEGMTSFTGQVFVPVGSNRRVKCEVYEADGAEPAFTGQTTTDIFGESQDITIPIKPTTVMLWLTSKVTEVTVGDTFVVDFTIENAVNLYAITAELEFDETLIEPTEVKDGGVLGIETVSFFFDSYNKANPQRHQGRLSIGITRKGDAPGINTPSGTICQITFRAKKSGNATVSVANNKALFLEQPDRNPVPYLARMVDYLSRGKYSVTIK